MELNERIPALLLPWYEENRRPLPWRADRIPYHVWVSEIMCQQTRTEAVKAYYARFLEALPDIAALAACPEEKLQKLWEGLGYYSRARNLKRAALVLMEKHGGVFPSDYPSIRALPGIGDYTAAAISSICFGLPCPAVDGNVLRLVTRLTASGLDVAKAKTKAEVREALRPLYGGGRCGELTQALMELGALVCQPNHEPRCAVCPLRELCLSKAGLWKEIPFKSPPKPRRTETHTVLLLCCGGAWALRKRAQTGLLAGLWEFPNVPGRLDAQAALDAADALGCKPAAVLKQTEKDHVFTHIRWELSAYVIECRRRSEDLCWADPAEIRRRYSLPTAFRQFMDELDKGE